MKLTTTLSTALTALLFFANSVNAQNLRLLVPNSPGSGLNNELARQIFPDATIEPSTSRAFSANHSQLLKQSDAVLLTAESIQEYELENPKLSNDYEQLRVIAVKPLVLWASTRTFERARSFAGIEVAVPNDATGKEGRCTALLRKFGRSIQIQRYAKFQSAISDVKGGHLAGVCAPFTNQKDSSLKMVFASTSFETAGGQRIESFPGVPEDVLDGLTDIIAVYVPKTLDKTAKDRIRQAIDKSSSQRGRITEIAGWAIAQ